MKLCNNIFVTGSTGFIGLFLKKYFNNKYVFTEYKRGGKFILIPNTEIVIHLAGKAHDLKKLSNSNEYYEVNTELTQNVFDAFLNSNAKVFITLSSVKAVADEVIGDLTEEDVANPVTHYGKSKLLAEQYILSKVVTVGKRVYILRPCMIHGPGNKGNLNLLYDLVSKGFPWPLGDFENKRSFCSIENLCFIIKELIEREDIPSGVYNIADDIPLSTNEVIQLIAESKGKVARILSLNKSFIFTLARLGDLLRLPLNSERLQKLTESYMVSNIKIRKALGKPLPVSSREGLVRTFESFSNKKLNF
jgi:nucleoside-diphosphate-sugar epimerase